MKQLFLIFTLSFAFFNLFAQDEKAAPNVDDILSTYFENIGGADNWKALNTTRAEGKMSQGGMEFIGIIYSKRPNLQRMEIDIQGQQMIQAYDGEVAWWINPFMGGSEPQQMPAEMAEEVTSQTFEDAFIDYAEKGHTVEYIGEQEIDGAPCYELKLTKKSGEEEFFYFDTEYMVPIMQKTMIKAGPTKGQAMETYLSNYEEVDGFIMPMYIETRMNGAAQFSITITKMEFNIEVDDAMFAYPKADAPEEEEEDKN